jgi:trehalose-6-phosphate synthase
MRVTVRRSAGGLATGPLARDEVDVFYERVSNSVLWPLFHDATRRNMLAYVMGDVIRGLPFAFRRRSAAG